MSDDQGCTLSRVAVDRQEQSGQCGEPGPAPEVAAKARQVPVSFGLDSLKGAGLLERAEVSSIPRKDGLGTQGGLLEDSLHS